MTKRPFHALALACLALGPLVGRAALRTPVPARVAAIQEDFDSVRARAEAHFAKGAFALAGAEYAKLDPASLDPEQARWVVFRRADCLWRAKIGERGTNEADLGKAQADLERVVDGPEGEEGRDTVWVEACASLAELLDETAGLRTALPRYQAALDHWARSSDIETARRRYLDLVARLGMGSEEPRTWVLRARARTIPIKILREAARIAVEPDDRARAQYFLALAYAERGRDLTVRGRAERAWRAVLELGKGVPFYDAALFDLADHLESTGRPERSEGGELVFQPDYAEALTLYRRLLEEFEQGESAYFEDAERRVERILAENLGIWIRGTFLPGATPVYSLTTRNLRSIQLSLFPVDLARVANLEDRRRPWLDAIALSRLEPARSWTIWPEHAAEHRPAQLELALDGPIEPGAYVLQARGGGQEERALLLVSDLALTVKASADRVLVWATDAVSGEPRPGTEVVLHWARGSGVNRTTGMVAGSCDEDGVWLADLPPGDGNSSILATASLGDRQAWSDGWAHGGWNRARWRLFPHTDRPAYKPGQEVRWKLVARQMGPDGLSTPGGRALDWVLRDPSGTEWKRGTAELDGFGTAHGSLTTTPEMGLGVYSMEFLADGERVSEVQLFRLEEYELPEFEVRVEPARDDAGAPVRLAPGDLLEADIFAHYTSGEPVRGARVEVFVHRSPFYYWPETPDPIAWAGPGDEWGFPGRPYFPTWNAEEIAHETLWTDEEGRAHLSVDTPFLADQDCEYRIEARVIDASRREIVGQGLVRGTRTPYFAALSPRRRLVRPGEDAVIDLHTETADRVPVAAKGRITLLRRTFVQRWIDPRGETVEVHERITRRDPRWRLLGEETVEVEVAHAEVETDSKGDGVWRHRVDEPGHYTVRWTSPGDRELDVVGETQFYVADESTKSLGTISGGIELLVDEDTVEPGRDATLILLTPTSGRTVLLTGETETIDSWRVIRMEGTVEVIHLPITTTHIPTLWIAAVLLADGQSFRDEVELRVPALASVLDVTLTPNQDEVEPGSEGTYTVSVRDAEGNPVEAQLSLAVIDASLLAIQEDLAGDPRRIFLAAPRQHGVGTSGSTDHGRYRAPEAADHPIPDGVGLDSDGGEFEELTALGYTGGGAAAPREAAPSANDASGFFLGRGPQSGAGMIEKASAAPPRVRKDFRETALWIPDVVTDAEGLATVRFDYPDSTTRWRALARAETRGARFGVGEARTHTRLPLTTRLALPRFLTVGDEATLSCNFANETDAPIELAVSFEVEGLVLLGGELESEITVPARGAKRLDWRVAAREVADALVRVSATSSDGEGAVGDAIERRFPVQAHGIEALVHRAGRFAGPEWSFDLDVPAARDKESTRLLVQVTPNLAVTMLDALPYLADYPYGCTEQTLSRFVPSVVVAKTLRDLGLDPDEAIARRFGGIEEESAAATHSGKERDLSHLDDMTAAGLARLVAFQRPDGAFGWWKGGAADPHMTAYALWALSLARDAGVEVPEGMLQSAARYLARHLVGERDFDRLAFSLFALASYGGRSIDTGSPSTNRWIEAGFNRLRAEPGKTSAYGSALWALAAHRTGHDTEARGVLSLLLNGVVVDETPDTSLLQGGATDAEHALRTAHWGHTSFYRWSDSAVESTSFVVLALSEVDPGNTLLEPAVNWLLLNRRGAQWSNTRDTAIAVLALASILEREGLDPEPLAFEVEVNGEIVGRVRFDGEDVLRAPSRFEVDPALLGDGPVRIRIARTEGDGPLTVSASATFFSLEEPIPARGNRLFVHRRYERLVGRPTLLAGTIFDHVPLHDGDRIQSGERIESVLLLEAKGDLDYVLIEDLLPGGFNAVATKSGSIWIDSARPEDIERLLAAEARDAPLPADGPRGYPPGLSAHRELRANRVATFIDHLGAGFWEVRTTLVARTPGTFHALPLLGEAMYVPEIRSNGRELGTGVDG